MVPDVLNEFARVIEPGGPLLIGVQIIDDAGAKGWIPYDHRASPAYRCSALNRVSGAGTADVAQTCSLLSRL